jgi:hypothetical protein
MFEVDWSADAANELAAAWAAAPDRNAVTAASAALDRRLAINPADEGESRNDNQRVTFAAPLGVRFEVDPVARRVTVIACWWYRSR